MWTVLKYGGSSLTYNGFNNIIRRIEELDDNDKVVIVLSAIKGVTDLLLEAIDGKIDNISKIKEIHLKFLKSLNIEPYYDIKKMFEELEINVVQNKRKAITYGELLSTSILATFLQERNIKDFLMLYAGKFIKAENENIDDDIFLNCKYTGDINLFNNIAKKRIIITQGFLANTPSNKICLLGRGGSDTSASIIANMLNAKILEIWTDVNGMYTADPNKINNTMVIPNIGYEQAQELAAMGAKVLHPYCIIPCQAKNIPIKIKNTHNYDSITSTIIHKTTEYYNKLYAITDQDEVTVFNIKSLNMWNNYGFVYDIFERFSKNSIDINIITTSQFMISATTDDKNITKLVAIKTDLEKTYSVEMIQNCTIISVVGDSIKIQPYLPDAIEISKKYKNINMIHYSANDLSMSFVLPTISALDLLEELHNKLIANVNPTDDSNNIKNKWWYLQIEKVYDAIKSKDSIYLYDLNFIEKKLKYIREELPVVKKIFYAMKANNHQLIINKMADNNIGFECVSIEEVNYLRFILGIKNEIIFTPNFCKISEYEKCFKIDNITIIVDNIEVIKNNFTIFENKEIALRVDLNHGEGHHKSVITEGKRAKFGCPIEEIIKIKDLLEEKKINIIGLHSHRGSGIQDYNSWFNTACKLLKLSKEFNSIQWIDLGGGFGIDDIKPINFKELNRKLEELKTDIDIYIEPGRYLVSDGGVLVSKVNQIKKKENFTYIGISTGMNSLIRPSLYGSYHKIHNISKILEERNKIYNIVGPICETGDIIGSNRLLPETKEDDLILIENTGAYGHVMSSNYNMRIPAEEIIL
jgi:bifunctional diaminopimelate decarboxylase / aspartate kinase